MKLNFNTLSTLIDSNFLSYDISQATCEFECYVHLALSAMNKEDKCLPWYYPQMNNEARMCSPFEALAMREKIDKMSSDMCKVYIQDNCISIDR